MKTVSIRATRNYVEQDDLWCGSDYNEHINDTDLNSYKKEKTALYKGQSFQPVYILFRKVRNL